MSRLCGAMMLTMAAACGPGPGAPPPTPPTAVVPFAVESVTVGDATPRLAGTIAFHSDREGRNRLFVLDLATRALRRLTDGPHHNDEHPAWSPDWRRLAFVTTGFDRATWDIAVLELASGVARRLTSHAAHDLHPAWTPDGGSILFSSTRDGTQAVYRASLQGGPAERVSPPPHRALMPSPSPDGRRVVYTQGTPEGLRAVVQDVDDGAVRAVSPPGIDVADVRWSPDGSRIAFAVVGGAPPGIGIASADGELLQALAVEGRAVRSPSWSPDGRWLVVAATPTTGEDWDLVLLEPGAAAAYPLTSGAGNDGAPAWGPSP